jgi:hypothetical protein
VIRQELINGRPAVLMVVEFDHEMGSPGCEVEELLTAVTQTVKHAHDLSDTLCRVFSSTLLNGRRNFIEWSPSSDGRLQARREPDLLPPSLVTAELLNQSLAVYGSSQQQDAVQ